MERKMLLVGDRFPDIEVATTHGKMKLPDAFSGKWFVLFSYPADFAPIAATELVAFQKRYDDFRKLDCGIIGLSITQVFSHLKWVEWIKDNLNAEIEFSIIADTGELSTLLGVIHPDKWVSTVRGVFIVGPKGIVRTVLYYPQETGRNIDEIFRITRASQISDTHGVATPANWPENDLIRDDVILPPPQDKDLAAQRLDRDKCFDWWFCHKKLDEL